MGVHIWVNRGQLYLDIYKDGQRKRERLKGLDLTGNKSVDKETMRLAEIARAKRAQQLFSEEWKLVSQVSGRQSLYSYIVENSDKKKIERCKSIRSSLNYLGKYPGGKTIQLCQITEIWFTDYQEWLKKQVALNTADTYMSILRIALNSAVRRNILPRNPVLNVPRIKAPQKRIVWLNPDELKNLAKTKSDFDAGEEMVRAFLFACYTGLRISDMRTLKWGDIERNPMQIVKQQEKTKEQAYIPLSASAWALINDEKDHEKNTPVFPRLHGKKHGHYARLKQWGKAAGITKEMGWHVARHTFAVLALEGGCDIYTLSKLLGHTDVNTTQIYAQATDKMKRAAVDALPAVEIGVENKKE
jgi:integrase